MESELKMEKERAEKLSEAAQAPQKSEVVKEAVETLEQSTQTEPEQEPQRQVAV